MLLALADTYDETTRMKSPATFYDITDKVFTGPIMDSRESEGEWALQNEVKTITDRDLAAYREKLWLTPPIGPNVVICPLNDESVQGYATDQQPIQSGVKDILKVVKTLEGAGMTCCMVAEPALIYYGTHRVKSEWIICVPAEMLQEAADLFVVQSESFQPFRPSALSRVEGMEHLYPRFKFVGIALFFILMSAQACHLPCEPNSIEYSYSGLPYPKLHNYAQSLLDTNNRVDLDDLVDGMNLTLEWGEENLDLEGVIDVEWGRWKADALHNGKASPAEIPRWCSQPKKRREIWEKVTLPQGKKDRQRHKNRPINETRFWNSGQKDPRSRMRDYC